MATYSYPLVSIIIPLYNAEKHIAETIETALNQTWPNKEIIIINDSSTDNSLAIANKYVNENVKAFTQENKGASAARNYGLREAKGEYIQFLDADDLLSPDKIEGQMGYLKGSKTLIGLCRVVHFDDGDDYRKIVLKDDDWFCKDSNDPVDFLLKLNADDDVLPGYGSMIQPNSWLTPKTLIEKAGMWNEFRCPDDDGEFFCRVILASEGIKYSTIGTNYYRKHKHNNTVSGQKSLSAYESMLLSIDLKYSYLKERFNDPILERVFARHYWEIGVAAYPRYRQLSKRAINKALEYGYNGQKYKAGPVGTWLSKILGWRLARILTYLRFKV
ncbi:glycosyltransferase family 2 protein [Mucilaginibacter sp. OK098]|uniref:glycosyltransferase family 2 protein n=1 Tax=Mucilaginibacter sp. OK098 TaxID=1855297 RepID=UPI000914E9B7|nr:glycosyltransferase family 2 protein [Mucilaginibacter sp. OK098]SHN24076.1 Glycosyltransferase involved in cell wall bisynthesis [Mucilaginibacter sp. OK098]